MMTEINRALQQIKDKDEIHKIVDTINPDLDNVVVIITHRDSNAMSFGYLGNMSVADMVYAAEGFKNCLFNRTDCDGGCTEHTE